MNEEENWKINYYSDMINLQYQYHPDISCDKSISISYEDVDKVIELLQSAKDGRTQFLKESIDKLQKQLDNA